jgi:hypothetical protein
MTALPVYFLDGVRYEDLAPGGLSAIPDSSSLAIANGVLFFSADDGWTGPEPGR